MTLPDAITDALPPDDRMRIGTITSVNPTIVTVQGSEISASPVNTVNLNVGDTVAVLRQDASWLILGEPIPPASGIFPMYQSGYFDVTVTASTSATGTITFARPFRNPPAMAVNLNSAPGATSTWHIRAINITTTDFLYFIFGPSSTFTIAASFTATERTQ